MDGGSDEITAPLTNPSPTPEIEDDDEASPFTDDDEITYPLGHSPPLQSKQPAVCPPSPSPFSSFDKFGDWLGIGKDDGQEVQAAKRWALSPRPRMTGEANLVTGFFFFFLFSLFLSHLIASEPLDQDFRALSNPKRLFKDPLFLASPNGEILFPF